MTDTPTTMNVRGITPWTRTRIRHAARARGMTIAAYLAALVELHDRIRVLADDGDLTMTDELETLGLQTVRA